MDLVVGGLLLGERSGLVNWEERNFVVKDVCYYKS